MCSQRALYKYFLDLIRGRADTIHPNKSSNWNYFFLAFGAITFYLKIQKGLFVLEKLQEIKFCISKSTQYSKTKKIHRITQSLFYSSSIFIFLSDIKKWSLKEIKVNLCRNWNFVLSTTTAKKNISIEDNSRPEDGL